MPEGLERSLLEKGYLSFRAKPGQVPLAILGIVTAGTPLTAGEIQREIHRRSEGIWPITLSTVHKALETLIYERVVQELTSHTHYSTPRQVFTLTASGANRVKAIARKIDAFWDIFKVESPSKSFGQEGVEGELDKFIKTVDFILEQKPQLENKLATQTLPTMTQNLYTLLTD